MNIALKGNNELKKFWREILMHSNPSSIIQKKLIRKDVIVKKAIAWKITVNVINLELSVQVIVNVKIVKMEKKYKTIRKFNFIQ